MRDDSRSALLEQAAGDGRVPSWFPLSHFLGGGAGSFVALFVAFFS